MATTILSAFDVNAFEDLSLHRSTLGALQYLWIFYPNIAFNVNK